MIAALVDYRREGNPLNWLAFAARMRLTRMTGRIWLWTLRSTLLFGVLALLTNSLAMSLYWAISFTMPNILRFNPDTGLLDNMEAMRYRDAGMSTYIRQRGK